MQTLWKATKRQARLVPLERKGDRVGAVLTEHQRTKSHRNYQ